jgi:hypothetical protein
MGFDPVAGDAKAAPAGRCLVVRPWPNQFSYCNRRYLSLLSGHCGPPVKRRKLGQGGRPQRPKTYHSQEFPPVKSCVLLHSAISGKPAGGGGTCRSNAFCIQEGSPRESRRTNAFGSIGAVLDVKTFPEYGI